MDFSSIKLQGGPVYASTKWAEDYLATGVYPSIHDDVALMLAAIPAHHRRGAVDLGACHGLLSLRANGLGYSPVLGLEADGPSVAFYQTYLARPSVVLEQRTLQVLDANDMRRFIELLRSFAVTTVIARRVLPEILVDSLPKGSDTPADTALAGRAFTRALREAGVRFMVVEGRVYSKRSTHRLSRLDLELDAIGRDSWTVIERYRETVLLRLNP